MKPTREHATHNNQTYFVTSRTSDGKRFFQHERWARLFLNVLFHYREKGYLLHEFVGMPDHFHLLISPKTSLERAIQLVKGGFSYRAKLELKHSWEIWQPGFSDHRIRDSKDYVNHRDYIHMNPVRKKLCGAPSEYPYSSAASGFELDPVPQWLKPQSFEATGGTAKAVPFQNSASPATGAMPFQISAPGDEEAVPFQNPIARTAK